jgi:hypothetical protein
VWFGFDRPARIMDRGFAGVVAVPAWAEFMREATAGAKPEWYPMPPDVEKVAICRLSGARATDACRRADAAARASQAEMAVADAVFAAAAGAEVTRRRPEAPLVYEDLFPIGTAPVDTCPIHGAPAPGITDEQTGSVSIIRAASPLTVERVPQPDGSYRLVIRPR